MQRSHDPVESMSHPLTLLHFNFHEEYLVDFFLCCSVSALSGFTEFKYTQRDPGIELAITVIKFTNQRFNPLDYS